MAPPHLPPEEAMKKAAERVAAAKKKETVSRFSETYVTNLARVGAKYLLGVEGSSENGDIMRAFLFFRQAAQYGHAGANYELGVMYRDGVKGIVDSDAEKAAGYFTEAAAQNLPKAQYNLGFFYEQGLGVGKDPAKAVELWEKAADQGHTKARCTLAERYFRGQATFGDATFGVLEQNYEAAVFYWGLAADDGEPKAIHALAIMHEAGLYVPQSTKKALELYDLAAFAWVQQNGSFSSSSSNSNSSSGLSSSSSRAPHLPRWFKNAAGKFPKYKKRKFIAAKRPPPRLLLEALPLQRYGATTTAASASASFSASSSFSSSFSSSAPSSPAARDTGGESAASLRSPETTPRTAARTPARSSGGGSRGGDSGGVGERPGTAGGRGGRVDGNGLDHEEQQQAKVAAVTTRQSGEQQSRILAQLKKGEDAATNDTSPSEFELNFSGRSDLPHLNKNVRRRQKGSFQRLMREDASVPAAAAAAPATSPRSAAATRQKSNKQHMTKVKRRDIFPGIINEGGNEGAGGAGT